MYYSVAAAIFLCVFMVRGPRRRFHDYGVIFHSTNEGSHLIKDNISNPNLNNSTLLKNANLNNSILVKVSVIVTFIVEMTNGIFRSQSRALLGICPFEA